MTDLTARPAPDQLEVKRIGLERLRTAGLIAEPEYNRLKAKLEASAPPSAPSAFAAAPTPAFVLRPAPSWAPRSREPEPEVSTAPTSRARAPEQASSWGVRRPRSA
jgi:hypothetical protein